MQGLGAAAAAILTLALAAEAPAAETKQPPNCAAIAFRAVPSGLTDGQQDAGLYKSHFGRIELVATVKAGEAKHYFVQFNGKPLAPLSGAVPASVAACARIKDLAVPAKPAETCTGERFTVLIDHAADHRYILLYSRSGKISRFCAAGMT